MVFSNLEILQSVEFRSLYLPEVLTPVLLMPGSPAESSYVNLKNKFILTTIIIFS